MCALECSVSPHPLAVDFTSSEGRCILSLNQQLPGLRHLSSVTMIMLLRALKITLETGYAKQVLRPEVLWWGHSQLIQVPLQSVVQISPDTAVGWTHSCNFLQTAWRPLERKERAAPGLSWRCGSRSLSLQPSPHSSTAAIFRPFQHFPLTISCRRFGQASFCLAGVSGGAVTPWSTSFSPPQHRQPSTAGPGGYCSADLCQACANKICYHWPTS